MFFFVSPGSSTVPSTQYAYTLCFLIQEMNEQMGEKTIFYNFSP